MSSSLPSPAPSRAAARDLRRLRILASLQAGLSYAAIGRAEGLSRERVRQIVAKALDEGGAGTKLDHARVQIARLEPALRLAAGAVAGGDLSAIDRLLRVLDRLDRYSAVEGAATSEDEGGREKLLAKLNAMAERLIAARRSGLVDADGRPRQGDGEAALDAADSPDFVDDPAAPASAGLDVA
jgi:DNA-binding Lrp family transcriptional regulator